MPLRRTLIDVPLSSGLDQKSDVRSIEQSGAVQMVNCVRQKGGAITKRYGSYALPNTQTRSGTTENAAVRGQSYMRTPLLLDGAGMSTWSDTENTWAFVDMTPEAVARDRIPVAGATSQLAVYSNGLLGYDIAVGNGLMVFANVGGSTSGILTTVIDEATGVTVIPPAILDNTLTPVSPRMCVCGTTVVLAWFRSDNATQEIMVASLSLLNPTAGWTTPTMLFANDNINGYAVGSFDICAIVGDPTRFVIATNNNVGSAIIVYQIAVAGFGVLTNASFDSQQGANFGVCATAGGYVWTGYWTTTGGVKTFTLYGFLDATPGTNTGLQRIATQPAGLSNVGATVVSTIPGSTSVFAACSCEAEQANSGNVLNDSNMTVTTLLNLTIGGFSTFLDTVGNLVVTSKPAYVSGKLYLMMGYPSALEGTNYLACCETYQSAGNLLLAPLRLVATVAPRLSKLAYFLKNTGNLAPPNLVAAPSLGSKVLVVPIEVDSSSTQATIAIQPFDFASQRLYFGGQLGGSELGLSAGAPFTFDGDIAAEMGFVAYPENFATRSGAVKSTGGSVSVGSAVLPYSYIQTWEWTDGAGQIHRSGSGIPLQVSVTGVSTTTTGSITLGLQCLGMTLRQKLKSLYQGAVVAPPTVNPVQCVVYRTQAGGTVYYRVGAATNDPTTTSVTFIDTLSDTQLSTSATLYTQGGAYDNLIPPSARVCVVHKSRWFLAGTDDPRVIWPSKEVITGEVPGFNEVANIFATGRVLALASMDDKLIIFVQRGSEYGIEYITGEGPFDSGAQNDWTDPQPIPTDVGAPDQRSIVVGPFGCVFKSNVGGPTGTGGIFLLSRDLQTTYLSGPVEDLLAANPIVTSAVLHPNAGRVYFTCAPTDNLVAGDTGVRLVWDYLRGCWSQDVLFDFDSGAVSSAVRCAWVSNGIQAIPNSGQTQASAPLYHWASPGGRVYRETNGQGPASFVDSSVQGVRRWVAKAYSSAWIKPSMSGFARFWRVQLSADAVDPSQLTMALTYDYAPATYYVETASWTDAQIAAFDRAPQIDVQMIPLNQKSKAIQVTLTDSAPLGAYTTGRGADWAALSFELGIGDRANPNLPGRQKA